MVASFNDETWFDYRIGFPAMGAWQERFNSDAYGHWPNPWVAGNGGVVHAQADPMHGLPASVSVILPSNAILLFSR